MLSFNNILFSFTIYITSEIIQKFVRFEQPKRCAPTIVALGELRACLIQYLSKKIENA